MIVPHYQRFIKERENFEYLIKNYENKNNIKVTRLNDGEALFQEQINGNFIKIGKPI